MGRLRSKLKSYANSDYYRFHMPGHKGNSDLEHYQMDITEIDGFDNLHHPEDILKEEMEKAAEFYGTDYTFYLVNGSTSGILTAISAATNDGDTILVGRNCHKSVFNAIYLKKLKISYTYPQFVDKLWINGGILLKNIENTLNSQTNIKAIFITSPTYEGCVSDIKSIADIAHQHGIPLIVDEAHGAHFSRHKRFPKSAIDCGADMVIQSLHKTLDSMTQTALLHVCKNSLINVDKVKRYLSIYQTSSPSYVLMASINDCIQNMIDNGGTQYVPYISMLESFYKKSEKLRHLKVVNDDIIGNYGIFDRDISKIVISTKNAGKTGKWLYDELRTKYHLQPEMASGNYVICMTSFMDTEEGLERLWIALEELDRNLELSDNVICDNSRTTLAFPPAIVVRTISEAIDAESTRVVKLTDAAGKVSAEYAYIYPPGIPIIAPGEVITNEVIKVVNDFAESGLEIQGIYDEQAMKIKVL